MKLKFLFLASVLTLSSPALQAEVAETQFKLLEPATLDFGTSFNYRSTKYSDANGTTTLTGYEQPFYLRLGIWQDFTLSLDTSYLDLRSQENQINSAGVNSVYERTQSGITNLRLGALYRHNLEVVHMFYGLSLSIRPGEKETELTANAEKSNAVSRQNAIIPMVGVAVPLAEVFVVGAKGSFALQQEGTGKVTDKTREPSVSAVDTYREGNIVNVGIFGEIDIFLRPFVSVDRSLIYSTRVSREGGVDYRIPGGKVDSTSVGLTLPLLLVELMPTYTFSKYTPDEAGSVSSESSYLSIGARLFF